MDDSFNPEMLVLARESRGMSQTELARRTSPRQSVISRFESGSLPPPADALRQFSRVLHYPLRFFSQTGTVFGLGCSFLFHRRRSTLRMTDLRRIQAEVNIVRMAIDRLLRGVEQEPDNEFPVFDLDLDGGPEQIARFTRAVWSLPLGPIADLTRAIEAAGGIVLPFPFVNRKIDGLSLWVMPTPPLFLLNRSAPADRTRWTLAHELGHVVMHGSPTLDMEHEADRFASEFLMPADEIHADLQNLTLPKAAQLKRIWRVSIQTLVRRARDLQAITESRYKSLCVQISRAGIRVHEPNPIAPELPQNLPSLIEMHRRDHGYSVEDLSALTNTFPDDFASVFIPNECRVRIAR